MTGIGERCPTCGHDDELTARFVRRVKMLEKQLHQSLAKAAIAENKLVLVGLEREGEQSWERAKIARQRVEIKRLTEQLEAK